MVAIIKLGITALCLSYADAFSDISRRDAIEKIQSVSIHPFVAASMMSPIFTGAVIAEETTDTPIQAQWTAVDGLDSLSSDKQFISFSDSAYKAMVDDPSRTPQFERAIIDRLNSAADGPGSQVVLDLGTGPFALFAIIAAKNGAGKV